MAFTLKDERAVHHWDSGPFSPSTSPADIFHGMNTVLAKTQKTVHPPPGLGGCVTSAVDSCVPSTPSRPHQDSYLGLQSSLITAAWLGMGLEDVRLDDWRTSLDTGTHSSPPSIPPPLGSPPGLSILGPLRGRGSSRPSELCTLDRGSSSPSELCTLDRGSSRPSERCILDRGSSRPSERCILDRGSSRPSERCILDRGSARPSDCEFRDFSCGPEQLSDLLSSLQICPTLPLKSGGQKDPSAALSLCHLEQDSRWPRASERLSWGPDRGAAQRTLSIEAEACLHRQCAALSKAPLTWRGTLPPKNLQNQEYSCKVFLGGLPWDITEARLNSTFSVFGHLSVEWPGKDIKAPCCPPRGYVYLMFEQQCSVAALLEACCQLHPQEFYYHVTSHKMRVKKVQVIPWVLADSNFSVWPSQRLAPSRTVFVGGLHGMMNAQALALIMNDLFGGVTYVGIDTDRHKYPIGSGRVSFSSHSSYLKSLHAAFVEIKTPKFTKKVQIDPYVEDSVCQRCGQQPGLFFCRDMTCFRYYCNTCWHWKHSVDPLCCHRPIMKNQRGRHSS